MKFLQKLNNAIEKNNSLLCIGLDSDLEKIPSFLLKKQDPIFEFNKEIINQTYNLVCAYKPNIAYYESHGAKRIASLKKTVEYINKNCPDIPLICDAKRADIGSSSEQYAKSLFDYFNFDALTVNPYLGFDSIEPFLNYKNKGIIVLCRTSNPGASDFQDLIVEDEPLYIKIAKKVNQWNKKYKNCLMVVGATWPAQLREVRKIAPNMFFLIPGIGAQGGDLEKTLRNGLTKEKSGLIINSSRTIIYASSNADFASKARKEALSLKDLINEYRKKNTV